MEIDWGKSTVRRSEEETSLTAKEFALLKTLWEARGNIVTIDFVYGFWVVITLITIIHTANSIAMSVSDRTRQYGAMRAVGGILVLLVCTALLVPLAPGKRICRMAVYETINEL